jgi:UDP-N-acetylmuramoylalanine--D-glutamate ligase
MARWLVRQDACVRVADSRPRRRRSMRCVPRYPKSLICLPARSPGGLRRRRTDRHFARRAGAGSTRVQAAMARGVPVVSEIELFAWAVRDCTPTARLIAITGSNGKTTTTALTGALCRAAGRRTAVAGNIGPAALDALMVAIDGNALPEIWVLELSSFQLETTHT